MTIDDCWRPHKHLKGSALGYVGCSRDGLMGGRSSRWHSGGVPAQIDHVLSLHSCPGTGDMVTGEPVNLGLELDAQLDG